MSTFNDNPAGRLHTFFEYLLQQPANADAWTSIAGALGIENPMTDQIKMWRRLSVIVSYPERIDYQVRSIPDQDYDLLLRWIDSVKSTLGASGPNSGHAEGYRRQITADVMLNIEHCSSLLHRHRREPEVAAPAIVELTELVHQLIAELYETEDILPETLRLDLLRIAYLIRDAVEDVASVGDYRALETAIEGAIGFAVLRPKGSNDETAKPWYQKLGRIVFAGLTALSIASSDYTLAQSVFPQLPSYQATTVVNERPIIINEQITVVREDSGAPEETPYGTEIEPPPHPTAEGT